MKNKQITFALGASLAASASLSAAISSEKYVYDASGNIVEKQIGEEVTQLEYEGNLLKGSLLNASRKQYQYDGAGRLVVELENGQVVRTLNYQFADKVTEVQNGDRVTELFYNAEGQLVGTKSAESIETFAWDGLAIASRGEQAYSGEDHGVGGVPAMVGTDVIVSDMIGNTLSSGQKSFDSCAFGSGLSKALFTGKPFIEELGSFIFKHRNYHSEAMRWSTVDPSGYPDGDNNYLYVNNEVVVNFDPDGLATDWNHNATVFNKTNHACNGGSGWDVTLKVHGAHGEWVNGSVRQVGKKYDVKPNVKVNYDVDKTVKLAPGDKSGGYHLAPLTGTNYAHVSEIVSVVADVYSSACGSNKFTIPKVVAKNANVTLFPPES